MTWSSVGTVPSRSCLMTCREGRLREGIDYIGRGVYSSSQRRSIARVGENTGWWIEPEGVGRLSLGSSAHSSSATRSFSYKAKTFRAARNTALPPSPTRAAPSRMTSSMMSFLSNLLHLRPNPTPISRTAAEDESEDLPISSLLSWIPSSLHPLLRTLLIHSLRLAPRPRHIAFIMDGNRRSARLRSLPVRVGHEEGFEALKRVLSFLLKLEIPHVTVYAFSIENFNRDPREVDTLMEMARKRLVEICQHG